MTDIQTAAPTNNVYPLDRDRPLPRHTAMHRRQPSQVREEDTHLNEIKVMAALKRAKATLTISTTVDDEKVSGELVWFDMNNIAIRVGDKIRVFLKSQIVEWTYNEADIDLSQVR